MKNTDYSKIADSYSESKTRHNINPDEHINNLLQHKKKLRVLDVGCGTGNYLMKQQQFFEERGQIEWFGIDSSEAMLDVFAKNNQQDTITIKLAAAEAIPFEANYFDYVICNHSYHHFADKEKAFAEIFRVLRKKGVYCIHTIHPYDMKKSWVYQFFPNVYQEDISLFYSMDKLFRALETAGFNAEIEKRVFTYRRSMKSIQEEAKLRNYSQLQLISDVEYENGIIAIENFMQFNKSVLIEHAKLYPIGFKS
ncbi:ubiquinone/menaquinone biosynthesis C-methylase UbiE [Kordia periserrulae]|uniref:Ubiquinone/menaquinone biosynthesis C-methylase UbiE n=1 Tax=Kordia periserrulae TaxID=701523 RepID=A0A2T6C1F1_9FLAO|nr:class I SAM-dependent methyltransferase [Kordia periserrulae]PTX62138.1 ubiquinone/menaquinone biosynthesis C-methylase UbiE [Kordia periserrulae]